MHTDRKIGFAMGILLIGIVAALFFRNEPLLSTRVAGVRREQQLNDRLRERDVAVYLNGTVAEAPTEQTPTDPPWTLRDVLQKMDERNKTVPVPVGARSIVGDPVADLPDEELDGYRPKKKRRNTSASSVAVPSPSEPSTDLRGILNGKERSESQTGKFGALPPLLPAEPARSDVVKLPSTQITEPDASSDEIPENDDTVSDFQPPEVFEEYVVKYGDTLSGIAQRMLGSQKKFMDIYNANQDRMASPDRLEVGRPLRIPRIAENERTTY